MGDALFVIARFFFMINLDKVIYFCNYKRIILLLRKKRNIMKKYFFNISFLAVILLPVILSFTTSGCGYGEATDDKDLIQIFHHDREPSVKTLEAVNEFFAGYDDKYEIKYYDIKDDKNNELLTSLGLPEDHFPFAIAINGKTSAKIKGEVIIFANLPDFMHHIGRRQGNWTMEHLQTVLENKQLLLPENPEFHSDIIEH